MSRLRRIILPNTPHHVTQRGNRRQQTFFSEKDYKHYMDLLQALANQYNIQIEAFCLMPNHVHLILVPERPESLIIMLKTLNETYARYVNQLKGWKRCLWQGRYFSTAMSQEHFERCVVYVEENPIRAKLVSNLSEYKWNSKRSQSIAVRFDASELDKFKRATQTGRPFGNEAFIKSIKKDYGYDCSLKKSGPKKRSEILNNLQ
jgi:putative transposase